jgi:hypothetical protein
MDLTEHFSWAEVIRSPTARRMGITNLIPNQVVERNVERMAGVMEEIRALVGRPIKVNSWYRSLLLNTAIGGSRTSAHMRGLAVDWEPVGMSLDQAFSIVMNSNIQFDQLIKEGTRDGADWIHLGLSEGPPRNQVLLATGEFLGGKMNFQRVARG